LVVALLKVCNCEIVDFTLATSLVVDRLVEKNTEVDDKFAPEGNHTITQSGLTHTQYTSIEAYLFETIKDVRSLHTIEAIRVIGERLVDPDALGAAGAALGAVPKVSYKSHDALLIWHD
jgi:hypothetical protein